MKLEIAKMSERNEMQNQEAAPAASKVGGPRYSKPALFVMIRNNNK
jgi:hypothetical protein